MTGSSQFGGIKAAIWLTFVVLVGWVVCFWPARYLRGGSGVRWMTLAAVCCLVPGWIVVLLSRVALFRNDLAAMLIQTMLRLGMVGAVALAVSRLRPELGIADFYGWLIVFYLLALVAETKLGRAVGSKS